MNEPVASLQREILFALGNGTETTLLLLEMLSDGGVVPEEPAVLQALKDMEAALLVSRQTMPGQGTREPGVGIPELELGRAEVVWWELTEAGTGRLQEERRRRGW